MHSPLALFKVVAKAGLNYIGFGIAGDIAVEVVPAIAREVWDWWGRGRPASDLRAEIEKVAQLGELDADKLAAQVLSEVSATPLSEQAQQQARAWLRQMPALVRATQRRPTDLLGRTVALSFPLADASDLLPLIPARLPRFKPGDRPVALGGDWTLSDLLGTGGFGEVWKATHPTLPPWAVKFCLDPSARRSLQNEAELLGRVIAEGTHPGIVRLINASLSHDPPFLVYEFVDGGELTVLIREWHCGSPNNLVKQATQLLYRLAGIIAFAHQRTPPIVHRDLKPANILLERTAHNTIRPRVADFGIGGVAEEKGSGQASVSGIWGAHTPIYASPQQKRPGSRPDPRDDVHALGVIWLHMLTGDLSLEAGYWREALTGHDVPEEVYNLLGACVAHHPDKRPANAAELEARLAAILTSQPPLFHPTSTAKTAPVGKAIQSLRDVPAAHARARGLAANFNYAGAVEVLEGVAQQLRDAALYTELRGKRDEVMQLEQHIAERIGTEKYLGLFAHIERLLALAPNRADLRELLNALPPLPKSITNALGMHFVLVQPGSFVMGSPENEPGRYPNETQHVVAITHPFYLCIHPVTVGQWRAFAATGYQTEADHNKGAYGWTDGTWKRDKTFTWQSPGFMQADNHPVTCISWKDAVAFCEWLNRAYSDYTYRLPTEAEWEYACRGGVQSSTLPFNFKHLRTSLSSEQANFNGGNPFGGAAVGLFRQATTPVGSFEANVLDLFDLHGNVWEWCADWYAESYYTQSDRENPAGPASGTMRVLRGGSWYNGGYVCRAACRYFNDPGGSYTNFGFRVVLCLD